MIRDGEYTAWFRTSRGEGTGIVHLADGRITGGDCFFAYCGTYQVDQDRFSATLTTRRRAEGPTTIFGVDEIELRLTGVLKGTTAWCCGTAAQAPSLPFEATLFSSHEPLPAPGKKRPVVAFDAARLPRLLEVGQRGRNPFAQR
jgi:hypothetical protein